MRSSLGLMIALSGCSSPQAHPDAGGSDASDGRTVEPDGDGAIHSAMLYLATDDGAITAYDVGTWAQAHRWPGLPLGDGVRGVDADATAGVLYIAHGSDAVGQSGHLLAWSLTGAHMLYDRTYDHGVNQLALGGGKIYMPAGEVSNTDIWYVLDPADGSPITTESGGIYPHNTMYLNGHRYLGGRLATSLVVHGIGAGTVGPSPSIQLGVRPFTINAQETRAWITWTAYRGFSVGDIQTGAILKSVNFGPVPSNYVASAPSHGISLSPDGSELYVLDTPNNTVRVYDGSDDPQLEATIAFQHPIFPGDESPCAYDCRRDGWILHSRDGHYVYVGDSGDVIDTQTRTVTGFIPELQNSRHGFLEIELSNGVPTGTTTHFGHSYP